MKDKRRDSNEDNVARAGLSEWGRKWLPKDSKGPINKNPTFVS